MRLARQSSSLEWNDRASFRCSA